MPSKTKPICLHIPAAYCTLGGDAASTIPEATKTEPAVNSPAAAAEGSPNPRPASITQPKLVESPVIAVPTEEIVNESAVIGEDEDAAAIQKIGENCGEPFHLINPSFGNHDSMESVSNSAEKMEICFAALQQNLLGSATALV